MSEKKEIKITKKEKEALIKISVCQSTCKKLIEEVVRHFEAAEIQKDEWWEAARRKYKLKDDDIWFLNSRSKTLVYKGKEGQEKMQKFVNDYWLREEIKKQIKEAFGEKAKSP